MVTLEPTAPLSRERLSTLGIKANDWVLDCPSSVVTDTLILPEAPAVTAQDICVPYHCVYWVACTEPNDT